MKHLSLLLLPLALVGWGAEPPSRVLVYQERIRGVRAMPIFLDGIEIASLRHRWSYFVLQVAPGEHTITGRHKENQLLLEVQSGKDYYLRLDDSFTLAGMKLTLASCQEARTAIESGKLRPIEPADVRDQVRVLLKLEAPACRARVGNNAQE